MQRKIQQFLPGLKRNGRTFVPWQSYSFFRLTRGQMLGLGGVLAILGITIVVLWLMDWFPNDFYNNENLLKYLLMVASSLLLFGLMFLKSTQKTVRFCYTIPRELIQAIGATSDERVITAAQGDNVVYVLTDRRVYFAEKSPVTGRWKAVNEPYSTITGFGLKNYRHSHMSSEGGMYDITFLFADREKIIYLSFGFRFRPSKPAIGKLQGACCLVLSTQAYIPRPYWSVLRL